jgi:carbon monoxide dehydrogenase subunit G
LKFRIDGKLNIRSPLEKTYAALTNPEFMATCIPDMQSYDVLDSEHFNAKVRVGIGIVRGVVDMKFELREKVPSTHAKLVGDGSGAGSKMHIDSVFDLSTIETSTDMTWAADADLSGLMAGIGGPILKGQSEKQVARIFQNVRSKLES